MPQYFRVVRNHVTSIREETYVEAARALGARPVSPCMRKYVFFNVVQNVPVIATLNAADAILTLAALGFLGYGIQPTDAAEWGYDIQRAVVGRGVGHLVDGPLPGPRDRDAGDGDDAARRGAERDDQPGAAASGGSSKVEFDQPVSSPQVAEVERAVNAAPVVSVRDLRRLLRHRPRPRAGRRRRVAGHRRGRDRRARRRVGLRQVDARPRHPRAPARRRRGATAR